jgi:hypothetical protein
LLIKGSFDKELLSSTSLFSYPIFVPFFLSIRLMDLVTVDAILLSVVAERVSKRSSFVYLFTDDEKERAPSWIETKARIGFPWRVADPIQAARG